MRCKLLIIFLCALLCALPASGARKKGKRAKKIDCPVQLHKAIARYEKGRYGEVAATLNELRYQCSGHSIIDTALYYLGMSLLNSRKPIEAQIEFERLIQNFPGSPFREESLFRIGYCSYVESHPYDRDQAETKEAIRRLGEFIEMFPESHFSDSARGYIDKCRDKLARKEYGNALFYHRIKEYAAAIVYYRTVLDEFPQSQYVTDSKVNMTRALISLNRETEAREMFAELIDSGEYDENIVRKVKKLRDRLDKKR